MSDLPAAQRQALEAWAEHAIETGWLSSDARLSLSGTTTNAPGDLFEQTNRPLVAGLFGGTGVGKSTLLNRLAAEPIARASAERPTSRGITLYVHRSILVDRLHDTFPMERMRTSLHNNQQYRDVLFIDIPDFDSVESANRDLVDIWLPHLDVVLYVVSPERYRDDQGWRLLLQHSREHAWLFVMNHWDRADPAQLEDFRHQLAGAGLNDPLIFRTDSSTPAGTQSSPSQPIEVTTTDSAQSGAPKIVDDFDALQTTLKELSDQSIIENLQEHGILARLKALKNVSDAWLNPLGNESAVQALSANWQAHWQKGTADAQQTLQWKIQVQSEHYAQDNGFWLSWFKRKTDTAPLPESKLPLIDEAFLIRLDNILDDYLNQQAQQQPIALGALKQAVARPYALARRDVADRIEESLGRSLALPGTQWQRSAHKTAGILCTVLPLASMGWITWRVVAGFLDGGSDPSAYLSSNFAINGAMLLGLSWLIPAFAHKKVKPSRQQAAARGMNLGVNEALSRIESQVSAAFNALSANAATLRSDYQQLWQSLPADQTAEYPDQLKRLLASDDWQNVQRSLDVRANTHNSTDTAPVS
jgi:hypothetical protein